MFVPTAVEGAIIAYLSEQTKVCLPFQLEILLLKINNKTMQNIKALAWENKKTIATITYFVLLVGIATVAPLFHSQPITGPIVNATLFVSVVLLGTSEALLVGLIPSVIALSVGTLPAVLAPMIPFIMLSNAVLIIVFALIRKSNYWAAVILASLLKFLFLLATSSVVINLLLKKEVATKVAAMMSWPQLLTALGGGLLAFIFLKVIKKV